MAKTFPLVLILVMSTGCSSFFKEASPTVKLERSWARQTVKSSYMGHRQPATITPIFTKDVVIGGNAIDGITAYSRKTGHQVWRHDLKGGAEGVFLDPQSGIFFGSNNGQFYHMSSDTGSVLWNYPLNSESTSAPLVQGNYIFHMAMNGSLYAMEKESGRVLWVKSRPPKDAITIRGTTQPLFHNGRIYVGYSDGYFIAYNAADGAVAWERRLSDNKKFNDIDSNPVVADQCILVANFSEALYCLDKTTGQTRWEFNEGGSAQPIIASGNVVIYSTENAIVLADVSSGKVKKKFPINTKKWGLPTAAVPYKSFLIFGLSSGPVVLMDRENGQWVDTFDPGRGVSAMPALDSATGDIYVVSGQGNIYALQVREKDKSRLFSWGSDYE